MSIKISISVYSIKRYKDEEAVENETKGFDSNKTDGASFFFLSSYYRR